MSDKILRYITNDILDSCTKCGEVEIDDDFQISLDGTNPDWPDYIIGTLVEIEKKNNGREYLIKFDDDDLNGGPHFHGCNIEVTPWCCCDRLDAELSELRELIESLQEQITALLP